MNFRIIEGDYLDYESLIPAFIRLYNDNNVAVKDIRAELGISVFIYNKLRKGCLREGLIQARKSGRPSRSQRVLSPDSYCYRTFTGSIQVTKKVDDKRLSFGCYKDMETARMVRDKLVECGWDKSQLERIKMEVLG